MAAQMQTAHFTQALTLLLDETFDDVHGLYLDPGTSLFATLATISAAEASVPVGGQCATLAAQVKHVAFYLDVLEEAIRRQRFERQDWEKIWRETRAVTPEEWEGLQASLRESYNRVSQRAPDRRGHRHRRPHRIPSGRDSPGAVHAAAGRSGVASMESNGNPYRAPIF